MRRKEKIFILPELLLPLDEGSLILLLTEAETSKEHKLLVQLYESINTSDQAIAILGRICFADLQDLLKKLISIKTNESKN